MKVGIHPEMKDTTIICACGAKFNTKSTKEDIHVEVCSQCHSFYTGAQGRAKRADSVEKFNRKYGYNKDEEAAK